MVPMPSGVPVKMMSPATRVVIRERYEISVGTSNIRFAVVSS